MFANNKKSRWNEKHRLITEGELIRWNGDYYILDMLFGDQAQIVRIKDYSLKNIKMEKSVVDFSELETIAHKFKYLQFLENVYTEYIESFHTLIKDELLNDIEADSIILVNYCDSFEIAFVENISTFFNEVQVVCPFDGINSRYIYPAKICLSRKRVHESDFLKLPSNEEIKKIIIQNDLKKGIDY